jgi:hypothetical protein
MIHVEETLTKDALTEEVTKAFVLRPATRLK